MLVYVVLLLARVFRDVNAPFTRRRTTKKKVTLFEALLMTFRQGQLWILTIYFIIHLFDLVSLLR